MTGIIILGLGLVCFVAWCCASIAALPGTPIDSRAHKPLHNESNRLGVVHNGGPNT